MVGACLIFAMVGVIALRLKRSASVGEKENEAFFFASRWRERHNSKIRAEIQRGSKLSYTSILP